MKDGHGWRGNVDGAMEGGGEVREVNRKRRVTPQVLYGGCCARVHAFR